MSPARTATGASSGSGSALLLLVLVAAFAPLLGRCASTADRAVPGLAEGPCVEARYGGRLEGPERTVRFVARVRTCGDALLVEARARMGGPSFIAAVRGPRARLLLARRRLVVDGPDTPAFWMRHAGVPLAGRWLLEGARPGRRFGDWTVRVAAAAGAGEPPRVIEVEGPDGRRLRLERRAFRHATSAVRWPDVPAGFEHREER